MVLDELPVEEIDGRLGPPGDIVVCEPGIRVAIYDAPWRRVKDALVTWKNASAVDAVEHAPRGGSRGR